MDELEQPVPPRPRLTVGQANHERPHNDRNGFLVKWGETIGEADCPLMRRWVFETPLGSLRLHHFLKSDDDRAPHDHPWWFLTLPLSGGYVDATYCPDCPGHSGVLADGSTCSTCQSSGYRGERVRVGRPKFRRAGHAHMVKTDGCWTLIITGRKRRPWGFWDKAGAFFESRRFFRVFGHAPCE